MNQAKTKKRLHVKRGDTVVVTSGKDKGKVGNVKEAFPVDGTILVEGINIVTKSTKSNPMKGIRGGLIKIESPIASSKVMLYCVKCEKPTRIKHLELESGAKTRVCMHCKEQFDV